MRSIGFRLLAPIGGGEVVASAFLPWRVERAAGPSHPLDTAVGFLINGDLGKPSGFSLGVLLIILGVLGLALAVIPLVSPARRAVGLIVIAVVAAFIFQVATAGSGSIDLGHVFGEDLRYGVWVALVGGGILAAS